MIDTLEGFMWVNGVPVTAWASRPMQLMGDGCGCQRERHKYAWVLVPCRRHAEELSRPREPNPFYRRPWP